MGSFTSAPKILNEDTQDADVELPSHMSRDELLQHCHQQLENLPALVKRSFRRLRPQFGDTSEGVRVLQWNVLSRGTLWHYYTGCLKKKSVLCLACLVIGP
jgi:hypothetical protein